jgi:hypothetical protein
VKFVVEARSLKVPTEWTIQLGKAEGNCKVETYTSGPWVVQVGYIPSAPIVGEYLIVIDHLQAILRCQSRVDAHGNLEGSFVTGS